MFPRPLLQVLRSHFLAWVNRLLGAGAGADADCSKCTERAAQYAVAAAAAPAAGPACHCSTDIESSSPDNVPHTPVKGAADNGLAGSAPSKSCCSQGNNSTSSKPQATGPQELTKTQRFLLNVVKDVGSAIFTFVNMVSLASCNCAALPACTLRNNVLGQAELESCDSQFASVCMKLRCLIRSERVCTCSPSLNKVRAKATTPDLCPMPPCDLSIRRVSPICSCLLPCLSTWPSSLL